MMEESVLFLDRLYHGLRERNVRERWPFEELVRSENALGQEVSALKRDKVDLEREVAKLRIEAADVVGRSDAVEAASRLEAQVIELQKDLKVSRLACEAARATEKSSQMALGETSMRLAESARQGEKTRADAAVLLAQRDEALRDVATLKGEYERARNARDATMEETRMYKKENDDLVRRLVQDKERSVTEMNSMNDIIGRLRKEIVALKSSLEDGDVVVVDQPSSAAREQFFSSSSQMRRCVQVHEKDGIDLASCEGLTISASTTSGGICFADLEGGFERGKRDLRDTLGAMAVAATDSLGAIACADRSIRLFDRHGRRKNEMGSAHAAAAKIHSVVFSSKTTFASGATDRQIKFWDVRKGIVGSRRTPSAIHSLVSPHPSSLISGHFDGIVRVWDSRTPDTAVAEVKTSDLPLAGLAVGPNFIAALGRDASLKLLDPRTLGTLASVTHPDLTLVPNSLVRMAADTKTVFVPSASGTALLFDAATGHCTATLIPDSPTHLQRDDANKLPPLVALDLDYSNKKKVLLTLDSRGFLRVWDCSY